MAAGPLWQLPGPDRVSWKKMDHFEVDVEVIADMVVINPFDFFMEDYAQQFPFTYEENLKRQLQPYLEITERDAALMELVDNRARGKNHQRHQYH